MKSIIHQSWPVSGAQGLKQSYELVSNGSLQLNYYMLLKLKTSLESKRLRSQLAEGNCPDLCIFHNFPPSLPPPAKFCIAQPWTVSWRLIFLGYYSLYKRNTRYIRSMCKWRISVLLNDVHWCNRAVFLASLCLRYMLSSKVEYLIEVLFYVLYWQLCPPGLWNFAGQRTYY